MNQMYQWQGHNLDVAVFLEDSSGNPIGMSYPNWDVSDSPIFAPCFFESGSVDVKRATVQRHVPGKKNPVIIPLGSSQIFSASNGLTSLPSDVNLAVLFSRVNRFTVVWRLTGNTPQPEKTLLRHAVNTGFKLSSKDDHTSPILYDVTFEGEDVE